MSGREGPVVAAANATPSTQVAGSGDVPEFIGLLDRERLAGWLAKRGVDPAVYSLEGGHPSERYVLDRRGNEWVVFYSERGLETGLRSFQSEDLACRYLVDLLWKDHTVRPEHREPG